MPHRSPALGRLGLDHDLFGRGRFGNRVGTRLRRRLALATIGRPLFPRRPLVAWARRLGGVAATILAPWTPAAGRRAGRFLRPWARAARHAARWRAVRRAIASIAPRPTRRF